MKQKMIIATVCLSFLLGATAWSAPEAAPPATPDEITIATDDGGRGGAQGGGSESWSIRANDTALHSMTNTGFDATQGARDIDGDIGILKPGSFNQMLNYLQWTRLLDLKVPTPGDENGPQSGVTITLTRGGKPKSIHLYYNAPFNDSATSTTFAVLESLTKSVAWKTPAQFKIGTGLAVLYQIDDVLQGADMEAAKAFPRPLISVLDTAGKEVAVLSPNTDEQRTTFLSPSPIYSYPSDSTQDKDVSSFFTLAPGKYRLTFKALDTTETAPTGFAWRPVTEAMDNDPDDPTKASLTVKPGEFNFVVIRLEKKPAPR